MHNAALAQLAVSQSRFKDWCYYRFDIAPDEFAQAPELFHRRNFLGLNLTIPHKVDAMALVPGVSADSACPGPRTTLVWH